jgi:predicted small lipoprotein YifL
MSIFLRTVLAVGLSSLATACGRKGPLIYPDMLVLAAPAAVSALQSGSSVKLQFALPDKDQAGRPVQGVSGVKISRRAVETDQKDVCRSCMTDYRLLQIIYLEHLPPTTQRFGNRLVLLDGDVKAGYSYTYSIAPFTAQGVDGASSSTMDVRVATPLPAPVLKIESQPTELRLEISTQPLKAGRLLGYNLYRSSNTGFRPYQPLNREPLKGNEYVDGGLDRGAKYFYAVRALIMTASGDIAESAESNEVEGMLKDDE